MIHSKTIFVLLGLIIIIWGCQSKRTISKSASPASTENELTVDEPRDSTSVLDISISEMHNMTNVGDAYTINNAYIEQDILWLEVSYGGGCREHQFELLFNNAYLELESDRGTEIFLNLNHNGNGDVCRSIVRQNLRFNLKLIQDKGYRSIQIKLNQWESPLIYRY